MTMSLRYTRMTKNITHPQKNLTTLFLDLLQLFEIGTILLNGLDVDVGTTGDSKAFGHDSSSVWDN